MTCRQSRNAAHQKSNKAILREDNDRNLWTEGLWVRLVDRLWVKEAQKPKIQCQKATSWRNWNQKKSATSSRIIWTKWCSNKHLREHPCRKSNQLSTNFTGKFPSILITTRNNVKRPLNKRLLMKRTLSFPQVHDLWARKSVSPHLRTFKLRRKQQWGSWRSCQ